MAFLTELATNLTARNIPVVIYSGNDDSLVPHFGSEGDDFTRFLGQCSTQKDRP